MLRKQRERYVRKIGTDVHESQHERKAYQHHRLRQLWFQCPFFTDFSRFRIFQSVYLKGLRLTDRTSHISFVCSANCLG